MEKELRGGSFAYADYQTVVVKVEVDGVEGWGEAMSRSDPRVNALLVEFLSKGLIGTAHEDVASAWGSVWRQLRVRGYTRGPTVEALSGIEMALNDARGKLEGKPVSLLYSPKPSEEVRVFAGSLFESRGPLEAQAKEASAKGMLGAKVKVGFGVKKDVDILTRVRKAWPDGVLVADANGAYELVEAKKACDAFGGLGLSWFEEPVLSDDWNGYRGLQGSPIRIGAGEAWFVADFDWALGSGLVGVVEPSVSRCGGVGVEAEVARRAAAMKLGFSPMTGMNSGLSLAASLQIAAAFPTEAVEFNPFENPLQTELVRGLPVSKGGKARVSTKPGLGVEVDFRYVKQHLV